jgi:ribosomal protein S16
MTLKIQLRKIGRKQKPYYELWVVCQKTRKSIKQIGYYNPWTKQLNVQKRIFWRYIQNGAYMTNCIRHLATRFFKLNNEKFNYG